MGPKANHANQKERVMDIADRPFPPATWSFECGQDRASCNQNLAALRTEVVAHVKNLHFHYKAQSAKQALQDKMLAQYERQVAAQAPRMAQMEAELKKLKSDDQFKGMMALQGRLAAFEKENKELGSKLLQAQASSRGSQLAKAVSFSAHESFGAVPKDAGAPIAFQLPSEMSAEQRNIYELSLAAYDRFQHDLRSRLFFIESLHKWPKAETKDIDEGEPEDGKVGPEPR
jgi:hypothetical protein